MNQILRLGVDGDGGPSRGRILAGKGRLAEAIPHFEKVVATAPEFAEAGRFYEAVQTERRALDIAAQRSNPGLVAALTARISLFEAKTPVRE